MNKTTFLTRLKKLRPDVFERYEYTDIPEDIPNMLDKATMTCREHGQFKISPRLLLSGRLKCPGCSNEEYRKRREDASMERAIKVHGNTYDYSQLTYVEVNDEVTIGCRVHGFFRQNLASHLNGSKCPKCVRENDKVQFSEFLSRARSIHGDLFSYDGDSYTAVSAKLTIVCKRHGQFQQRASSHLAGMGCRHCVNESARRSINDFVASAIAIHGDKYDYSKSKYLGSKVNLEVICRDHGSFWISPNRHISSRQGCQRCWESKGEAAISTLLDRSGIRYVKEYRLHGYRYRYDFFLPDEDIFIEFHGKQHYEPVEMFGGDIGFRDTKRRDLAKRELLANMGRPLIVISHRSLLNGTVAQDLVRELRSLKWYWFNVNGSVLSFKRTSDVYTYFKIPRNVKVKDLVAEVIRRSPDTTELFV